MEFAEYMNPPILTDLMDQIEAEIAKKKKYKDVIVAFDEMKKELSTDTYYGKAGYAVYAYDGKHFKINREDMVETNCDILSFENKEDQRILKVLQYNYSWVLIKFEK